jgi:HAMP domain-containing protein
MPFEIGTLGLVILVFTGICSFAIGRWLSRNRRQKKAERDRAAAEAGQSRQVRRARERQRR